MIDDVSEKPVIRSYRDLLVWQKSLALVTRIYSLSRLFPKDEIYALTSQMRRASISIPSNIAEGFGRYSKADYVRFLQIAAGSLCELQTQLEIAHNLGFIERSQLGQIQDSTAEIERMLGSLIVKLKHPAQPGTRQ